MRKMVGLIVAWTPLSIVVGFLLYELSPSILFAVLSLILIIDIFGWLLWFFVLGYEIYGKDK